MKYQESQFIEKWSILSIIFHLTRKKKIILNHKVIIRKKYYYNLFFNYTIFYKKLKDICQRMLCCTPENE